MNGPRALLGPIRAMARPARPAAELIAVREAASVLAHHDGGRNAERLANEIAERVVAELMSRLDQAASDPFVTALASLEQRYAPSPFITLATCPEIDTISLFVERRVRRMRDRAGRYLSPAEQRAERGSISSELVQGLARRYCRHLRGK